MNKLVPKQRYFLGFCGIQGTRRRERHRTVVAAGVRG
jgi:hypothetical protein